MALATPAIPSASRAPGRERRRGRVLDALRAARRHAARSQSCARPPRSPVCGARPRGAPKARAQLTEVYGWLSSTL